MGLSPLSFAGCAGWWDADDASTFSFSSGTAVSQWRDKSGNARHFAQASASNQPSRSGTYGGHPTVVFDGSNDYLDTAAFTLAQPFTLFVAGLVAGTTGTGVSSVGGSLQLPYWDGSGMYVYAGTTRLVKGSGWLGASVLSFVVDGAASAFYADGLGGVIASPGVSGTTTGLRVAERNLDPSGYFQQSLFEVVAYDGALSSVRRGAVEDYLRWHWFGATRPEWVRSTAPMVMG